MHHVDAQLIHDMRNTVTVIRGAATELAERDEQLSEEHVDRLAEMIARRAEMLGHLLDDLATSDDLNHGELPISLRPVDLGRLCRSALADRHLPPGVQVSFDLDPDVLALGDPVRLLQVVDNLVTNAVRYGGPHLALSARQVGAHVRLEVSDDGDGVAEELRETLFESYTRGPESGSSGGSGLGLGIVRQLCEAHGGTVDYHHGPRSVFTVTLPALPRASTSPRPDAAEKGHAVTFWHEPQQLGEAIAAYAVHGLTHGESVVVVATDEHLELVETRLAAAGVDVSAVLDTGQLLTLDAELMHRELVREDRVDPERFEELIGGTILALRSRWQSTRVFGEIVDLYWRRGDDHLALQLERCWDELRRRVDFPLLCAYELHPDEDAVALRTCHDGGVVAA